MELQGYLQQFSDLAERERWGILLLKFLILFILLRLLLEKPTPESCVHLQARQQPTYTWKQHAHQEDTSVQEDHRSSLGSYHQVLRNRPRKGPLIEARGVGVR